MPASLSRKPPFQTSLEICLLVFFTSCNIFCTIVKLSSFPFGHIPYGTIFIFTKSTFQVAFQDRKECQLSHISSFNNYCVASGSVCLTPKVDYKNNKLNCNYNMEAYTFQWSFFWKIELHIFIKLHIVYKILYIKQFT